GLRAFTSDAIDLPLLNAYRLFGQMKGERLFAGSTGALDLSGVLHSSVRAKSDVNVIATRASHRMNVLVWNYHDDSSQSTPADIHLRIEGLPLGVSQVLLEHWRVDHDHSNAYTVWQTMGSPQKPSVP